MRFASHRDFQRALERALRRAGIPVAFSAGFTPHPRISYAGAAPTGTASEAEYLEVALTRRVAPQDFQRAVGAALPTGLDLLEVVEVPVGSPRGGLGEVLEASVWQIMLPGVDPTAAHEAAARFLAASEVSVERVTREGRRRIDTRESVIRLDVLDQAPARSKPPDTPVPAGGPAADDTCAILQVVVRHATPVVRPDDVLVGLRQLTGLTPTAPALVTRLAQGPLDVESGTVSDPLHPGRTVRTSDVTGA